MSEKRKDTNGRILKTGESQRPNGTYMFRYTDSYGKKCWCYASTLNELREKEITIQENLLNGIRASPAKMNVSWLIEQYCNLYTPTRKTTKRLYSFVRNTLDKEPFVRMKVKDVRQSNAKEFLLHLKNEKGYTFGTMAVFHSFLRRVFETAVQDDYIRKNPFHFKLSSIIPIEKAKKNALTYDQQRNFLSFLKSGICTSRWYDEIVILLETGLRISELCGLTLGDVDILNRNLYVNKQLQISRNGVRYIQEPKTDSGTRVIPLTDAAIESFRRVIARRPVLKREVEIDGCTGFLFLDKKNQPRTAKQFEEFLRSAVKSYNATHDIPLPHITPHSFRHTFITNAYNAGLDFKSLQAVAGHSDIQTTLAVYTHSDYDRTKAEFLKVTANRGRQN